MRLRLHLAVVLVVTGTLLAACGGGGDSSPSTSGWGIVGWEDGRETGPAPGDHAPNFRLEGPDGSTIELAAFSGTEPVVVNFLASWCANCMEEMEALQAVHASGVTVVGVNLRESADAVTKIATESGATFPIALDSTGKVTREYKVVNLPGTVILRADGSISTVIRGPITEQSLLDAVAEAGAG